MTSIYVGNITYSVLEQDLRELFSQFGSVQAIKLINDKETGKPKGFGFVTMDAESAKKAIEQLNGQEFMGRTLKVNEAKTQK